VLVVLVDSVSSVVLVIYISRYPLVVSVGRAICNTRHNCRRNISH